MSKTDMNKTVVAIRLQCHDSQDFCISTFLEICEKGLRDLSFYDFADSRGSICPQDEISEHEGIHVLNEAIGMTGHCFPISFSPHALLNFRESLEKHGSGFEKIMDKQGWMHLFVSNGCGTGSYDDFLESVFIDIYHKICEVIAGFSLFHLGNHWIYTAAKFAYALYPNYRARFPFYQYLPDGGYRVTRKMGQYNSELRDIELLLVSLSKQEQKDNNFSSFLFRMLSKSGELVHMSREEYGYERDRIIEKLEKQADGRIS